MPISHEPDPSAKTTELIGSYINTETKLCQYCGRAEGSICAPIKVALRLGLKTEKEHKRISQL